jgi:hypothetical protein
MMFVTRERDTLPVLVFCINRICTLWCPFVKKTREGEQPSKGGLCTTTPYVRGFTFDRSFGLARSSPCCLVPWAVRRAGLTTRESHIYPRPVFYLYRVFLTLVQITTFVPVGGTNRYKCPLKRSRQDLLIPNQYKCGHICTR